MLPLFCKWVHFKRKEFAPIGSKFFPFIVDPFSEGIWYARKKTESHKVVFLVKMSSLPFSEGDWCTEKENGSRKSCLPCQNGINLPNIFSPLKRTSPLPRPQSNSTMELDRFSIDAVCLENAIFMFAILSFITVEISVLNYLYLFWHFYLLFPARLLDL